MERPDGISPQSPRSIIGRWLAATVLRRFELQVPLLTGAEAGRHIAPDLAVVEAACELAMPRYFHSGYAASALSEFAGLIYQGMSRDRSWGRRDRSRHPRGAGGDVCRGFEWADAGGPAVGEVECSSWCGYLAQHG